MAITRQRETGAEWAATITEPITATAARDRLQYAFDYSTDAINAVMMTMHGTAPPAKSVMPKLYDLRDKVESGISTIAALAERTPDVNVSSTYVDLGRKLGTQLIDESNRVMDASKKSESVPEVATEIVKAGERAAGAALSVGFNKLSLIEMLLIGVVADEFLNKGRLRKRLLRA